MLCEATVIVKNENVVFLNEKEQTVYQDAFADLLETGRFADARIVCYKTNIGKSGGEKVMIPVHKCVLAARSKFFAAAFSNGMREAERGEVEIPPETGFSVVTVRAMLHFIYTAEIPSGLGQSTLIALFKAVHLYGIERLMDVCVDLLCPSVTNCCDMLSLAHFYGSKKLMKKAMRFMSEHGEAVKGKRGWRQLMESDDPNDAELKTLSRLLLRETPLTVENCAEVLRLCFDYGNAKLRGAAVFFMMGNAEAVRATDGWRRHVEESEDAKALKRLIEVEKRSIITVD